MCTEQVSNHGREAEYENSDMWKLGISADSRECEEENTRGCKENNSDGAVTMCQLRGLTRIRNNRNRKACIISRNLRSVVPCATTSNKYGR